MGVHMQEERFLLLRLQAGVHCELHRVARRSPGLLSDGRRRRLLRRGSAGRDDDGESDQQSSLQDAPSEKDRIHSATNATAQHAPVAIAAHLTAAASERSRHTTTATTSVVTTTTSA